MENLDTNIVSKIGRPPLSADERIKSEQRYKEYQKQYQKKYQPQYLKMKKEFLASISEKQKDLIKILNKQKLSDEVLEKMLALTEHS